MANKKNLIPQAHKLSVEEQSRGGKKSAETRKRNKELKRAFEILLSGDYVTENGEKMTGADAIATGIFKKAVDGDISAAVFVRDTAGQKPVEKVMIAEIDPDVVAEVERMVTSCGDETD